MKKRIILFGTLAFYISTYSIELDELQRNLDYIWILTAAILVFIMQAGFMALESGMSRAKNSINVAVKNLADFILATAGFWLIGFGLMFGESFHGIFGTNEFMMSLKGHEWKAVFFVFQAVFAGTAATIDSGAIAERSKFGTYLIISFITSSIIYPVFGHWAWGSFLDGTGQGWLEARGFLDFAGSTVVHSVGAWVALAGLIVVGPRIGKFNKDGSANKINPHNLVFVYLGTFILFFGWFGFNAGSTLSASPAIAPIAFNTMLAAAFGGISASFLSWFLSENKLPEAEMIANGVIGGLVGITASCAFVESGSAAIIGLVSGILVYFGTVLLEKLQIDDVVGAVPVHGFCGVWGTIAVGIFITADDLAKTGHTRIEQIGVQFLGVFACFVWTFGIAFLLLKTVDHIFKMRVKKEDELLGLNIAEHGASSSTIELANSIKRVIDTKEYSEDLKVAVEYGTEIGDLATYFNEMIDTLRYEKIRTEKAMMEQKRSKDKLEEQKMLSASELRKYYEYMEENVKEILGSIVDIDELLNDSAKVEEKVEKSTNEVLQKVDYLLNTISEVSDKSNGANRITKTAVEEVGNSFKTVSDLNDSAKEIQNVIKNISSITERTKLLAINASIEAARAGESGKGFAVVAEEVKNLAENSATSTSEITEYLMNMYEYIEATMKSIKGISEVIQNIENINSSIDKVINTEVSTAEREVEGILKQSMSDVNEILVKIEEVRDGAKLISEKVEESKHEMRQTFEKSDISI